MKGTRETGAKAKETKGRTPDMTYRAKRETKENKLRSKKTTGLTTEETKTSLGEASWAK